MATLVDIKNATQEFRSGFLMRRVCVLDRISLGIPERSVFGILGPNGAGKTTLLQWVSGFRRPTLGKVLIAGREAIEPGARRILGYMPERPYFPEFLTGERFLRYMGTLSGMGRAELDSRMSEVLERVGMTRARSLELKKYSKGMLQRIGIAQAILHDPQLVVLDEPMSGVDPVGRGAIRRLIAELGREGKTVVFSSHVVEDVDAICSHVALVRAGKVVGSGPAAQFFKRERWGAEIGVEGIRPAALQRLSALYTSLEEIPSGAVLRVESPGEQRELIAHLMEMGGRILSIQPIRPEIEEFYRE